MSIDLFFFRVDAPMASFAVRLKHLREQAGLTQEQLAELAGLNKFTVAQLEQGRREPALATAQALARGLGVTCTAFEEAESTPPTERPAAGRGRPRKAATQDASARATAKRNKGKGRA
jgi:transcriptional regulator with XRE-family HTH domain